MRALHSFIPSLLMMLLILSPCDVSPSAGLFIVLGNQVVVSICVCHSAMASDDIRVRLPIFIMRGALPWRRSL
jgi:hypothetical protein